MLPESTAAPRDAACPYGGQRTAGAGTLRCAGLPTAVGKLRVTLGAAAGIVSMPKPYSLISSITLEVWAPLPKLPGPASGQALASSTGSCNGSTPSGVAQPKTSAPDAAGRKPSDADPARSTLPVMAWKHGVEPTTGRAH